MNLIQPVVCEAAECSVITDQSIIAERYNDLLGDESKLRAESIEAIYLPETAEEVAWAVQDIRSKGKKCVISAGRTGIAGGAVPVDGGSIISLVGLSRFLGIGQDGEEYYVRADPGMSLASLTGILMKKDFERCCDLSEAEQLCVEQVTGDDSLQLWFPVNPTETSAHIGGIVATNASGARTFRWGATRDWVRSINIILADGRKVTVRRGEVVAENGLFKLEQPDGSVTEVTVTDFSMPKTKTTLGYPLKQDMDLIDLFIGSEGTLGIIVAVELKIVSRSPSVIGVLVTVSKEQTALSLVDALRTNDSLRFDAIEFFDSAALRLLKDKKEMDGAGSHIPDIPNWDGCGIYLEFSGTEEETEEACLPLEEVLEGFGLSLDDTWAAMEPSEMAAQRLFRHAVPEAVNSIIGQRKREHPGLHKVGTDMAVPDDKLLDVFTMYREGLEQSGIDSVIFGHIGDNHVHVNLLPKNMEELVEAKKLYGHWAKEVVRMGGAVAAEHGIGRMKKEMLTIQYSKEILGTMREVRKCFDPEGVFGSGVLFDD
ncbi:FAD-binding oxidoreductase [Desulforhopalus sp. 52FAK]